MKPLKRLVIGVLLMAALCVSASALSDGGTVTATALNMRSEPSTSAAVQTVVSNGTNVIVVENLGDWYQVYYNGRLGYMSSDYVWRISRVEGEFGTGVINADSVNMRNEPHMGGGIISTYSKGTQMSIIGQDCGWYKVSYNGQTGYVRSNLMDPVDGASSSSGSTTGSSTSSSTGQAIVDTAKQYLGVSYVYGGTSPSGFDCSGLVYYVYQQHGYSISRTAAAQAQNGVAVSKSDLQPGDIVYFANGSGGSIGHSGIYIGDGQFIHASSGSGKVVISDLNSSYYVTYWGGARRIV